MTPAALISSSAVEDGHGDGRPVADRLAARAPELLGVELLVAGQDLERRRVEQLLDRAATGTPGGLGWRSTKAGSRPMPAEVLHRVRRAGHAPRAGRGTAAAALGGLTGRSR